MPELEPLHRGLLNCTLAAGEVGNIPSRRRGSDSSTTADDFRRRFVIGGLVVSATVALSCQVAAAQAGGALVLEPTEPMSVVAEETVVQTAAERRRTARRRGNSGVDVDSASSRSTTPNNLFTSSNSVASFADDNVEPDPLGPGCSVPIASPATGADVPEVYFGPEPSSVNPSLIGTLPLLTAGETDTEARTVTLPLYRGIMAGTGKTVWYVVTDTTDRGNAQALGLNFSGKLVFSDTDRAVRRAVLRNNGELLFFEGAVDFSPERKVVAESEEAPFPPAVAEPGSVGDAFYSPLVKIINAGGHIYNAPIIAFGVEANEIHAPNGDVDYSKVHDSVVSIDTEAETVTLELVLGFSFARSVLYLSLDASDPLPAAIEGATFAPGLQDIELGNDDSLFSAVERIFIFTNGPRDCENPQRQGLEAAVLDGETPFNVLGGIPTIATDYSPLWDANVGEWTQNAIDLGYRSRLTEEFQILHFVENGFVTGPGGDEYGSTGFIINCPIVFRLL